MSDTKTKTAFGRIYPPREDWLAKAPPEPIIDPELEIIDTHHHLWIRRDGPRGESWGGQGHRYLLDEYLADCDTGHKVVGSVFVQCHSMYRAAGPVQMRPVGETEFVSGVAAMSDSGGFGKTRVAAGIVGFADLTAGDWVTPVLEAQIRAGGGRFRGVRHSCGYDSDPVIGNSPSDAQAGLYLRDDFRQGMKRLTNLGLSLDAWCFFTQLPDVTALARALPGANIVMCHCGGPLGYGRHGGRKDEVFAEWKKSVTELAKCPNVSIKLGGIMNRLAAYDFGTAAAPPSSEQLANYWRPYVETSIELFGANRCMAESNFPVEKMGIGFAALFNALKRLASGASAEEKAAIFAGTARRVYRLDC